MTRTLIVPDIHNATDRAEEIISAHGRGCDLIVLLGDYFDDYDDTPADAERVARWLVKSVKDPRRRHVVGNHDLPYLCDELAVQIYMCPGWSLEKQAVVSPILHDLDLQLIHTAVAHEGWLISHAGFHTSHLHGRTTDQLLSHCRDKLADAVRGKFDPIFAPSRARGFGRLIGGVTWLDWSREFEPVDGWHQIVGHSPARSVRALFTSEASSGSWDFRNEPVAAEVRDRTGYTSMNWCVDTGLKCVCIVEGNTFDIVWV